MLNRIIFLFLFSLSMAACKQAAELPTSANGSQQATAQKISKKAITQNDKIQIGAIQKKAVSNSIQCTGQIEVPPTAIYAVHSRVEGQINLSDYLPGDYVKKGTVLAKVENPDFIAQQRLLLETKAGMEVAKKDYERKKALKAGEAVPEKEYDNSKYQYELLNVRYEGLKKEMALVGFDVDALEEHQMFQSYIKIKANQSGYIHEILAYNGQRVSPETHIMTITETNHLHLELQILSKDITTLKIGQEVLFTLPNLEKRYKAVISKINPMLQPDHSSLAVHCDITDENNTALVPGFFVNAIVYTTDQVLEGLPIEGLVKEGEDYYAFKINEDKVEKQHLHEVKIIDDFVVFEGDKTGEWVIEGGYYVE